MSIIDPEFLAAEQARARQVIVAQAGRDDALGRIARLCLATIEIDVWAHEEFARGATVADVLDAVVVRAATMVGAQIVNAGLTGNSQMMATVYLARLTRQMADHVEASVAAPDSATRTEDDCHG